MTMTGRAAMTGNVTRIRRAAMTRNPITPVVVKVKVRRQLSCRFFPGPVVFASNFVVPGWKLNSKILYIFCKEGKDIVHFCCKSESVKTIE